MSVQQEKKKEIEPALIVPFVQSVRKVLATMAQMETTIGRPYGKHQPVFRSSRHRSRSRSPSCEGLNW